MQLGSATLVQTVLAEYGALSHAALLRHLHGRKPCRELYEVVADYPRRGGRGLRGSMCIAAARAFGATRAQAVDTAAALELMHNAFLVHDDIEDGSELRRGSPTLHVLHGLPAAVNAGDALVMLALGPLIQNVEVLGPRIAFAILKDAHTMVRESIEGQAIELGWRTDNAMQLHLEDYLRMVLKKTCWYTTIFPCRVGALIGDRGDTDPDGFLRFGFFLGAAFQIQDDILNLVGDASRYGKEIDGDLHEGKRTLMLIHLTRQLSAVERARLRASLALDRSQRCDADIAWIRERMQEHGSIAYASRVAHALAGAALHEFDAAFAGARPSRDLDFLRALPTWMLERA